MRLRLILKPGREYHRYTEKRLQFTVKCGVAWLTASGRDYYLSAGSSTAIDGGAHPAIISGLGSQPLVYEVSTI